MKYQKAAQMKTQMAYILNINLRRLSVCEMAGLQLKWYQWKIIQCHVSARRKRGYKYHEENIGINKCIEEPVCHWLAQYVFLIIHSDVSVMTILCNQYCGICGVIWYNDNQWSEVYCEAWLLTSFWWSWPSSINMKLSQCHLAYLNNVA
jgi:hypothetical protein